MRVFVTGASGFIGQAVVKELLGAGHQVTGLARSDNAVQVLTKLGVKAHAGSLHEPDTLSAAAAGADGVIHLAFIHGPGDIPLGRRLGLILGGSPLDIVGRFGAAITAADACNGWLIKRQQRGLLNGYLFSFIGLSGRSLSSRHAGSAGGRSPGRRPSGRRPF